MKLNPFYWLQHTVHETALGAILQLNLSPVFLKTLHHVWADSFQIMLNFFANFFSIKVLILRKGLATLLAGAGYL